MDKNQPTVGSPAYFFEMAAEQESWLNLYFMIDKIQASFLSAPCVAVKGSHFVVRAELAGLDPGPIVWGTDVNGYFTVRDINPVHCHFATRLYRMYNGSANSLYLVFPLPRYIDHNRRRFSRRVKIGPEESSIFGLWLGAMEEGDSQSLPRLVWHNLENTVCELEELSASGLRVNVPDHAPICKRMAIDNPVLLKGDFGRSGKKGAIFVLGNIVRKMPDPEEEGIMNIGCQFHSWRKIDAPAGHTWFRSDPREGIGLIAEWINRNYRTVIV